MSWRDELTETIQRVPDDDLPAALGELERHRALLWLRWQGRNGSPPHREDDPHPQSRNLTAKQVAQQLNVSQKFVYDHQRELGAVKIGGAVRFPEQSVRRYLARRR